jgi:hypothetical protein
MSAETLYLKPTPEVHRLLKYLTENGLFGTSVEDVAERLLCEKLREIVLQGWVRTQPLVHR